jgi:hypothetical protein
VESAPEAAERRDWSLRLNLAKVIDSPKLHKMRNGAAQPTAMRTP